MKPIPILLPLLLLLACGETSPVNTDPERHAEVVDRSRREGTVVISLDTIFDAGTPYAVILEDPVVLPGRVWGAGSRVMLLSGEQAIHIIPIVLYGDHYVSYRFSHGSFADTAYLEYHESMLSDAQRVVNGRLLTPGGLDTVMVRAFVELHRKPPFREPRRGEQVVRDRNQAISRTKDEIWQTGVRIGRFDSTGFAIAGLTFAQITVYHIDSVHCATITHGIYPADTLASVHTASDKVTRNVTRGNGKNMFESVLWYLVNQSYL